MNEARNALKTLVEIPEREIQFEVRGQRWESNIVTGLRNYSVFKNGPAPCS
jgi:hypothetical protein